MFNSSPAHLSPLPVCGQAPLNTRIVGGENAPPGSWPWQANLLQTFPTYQIMCGGSLINSKWVLSAAHSNWNVYLGRQELSGTNPNEQVRTLSSIFPHPLYNSSTHDNDLALLELSTTVTFSDFIRPICLAASSSTFYNGTETWVTGWGNFKSCLSSGPYSCSVFLSCSQLPVEVLLLFFSSCPSSRPVIITTNMICAGVLAGGKGSCQGDSGGPLVVKQGSVWIQAGIVSFGYKCAEPNYPGVYTRVSPYQTWINSIIITKQTGFVTYTSSGKNSDSSTSCSSSPSITITPSTPTTTTTTAKRECLIFPRFNFPVGSYVILILSIV
uniref:Zgc:100868 n=1 Tax=Paramormyrops kingsleyae TaxID=1676925 RepID=A0A3B3T9D2_9TELE